MRAPACGEGCRGIFQVCVWVSDTGPGRVRGSWVEVLCMLSFLPVREQVQSEAHSFHQRLSSLIMNFCLQ